MFRPFSRLQELIKRMMEKPKEMPKEEIKELDRRLQKVEPEKPAYIPRDHFYLGDEEKYLKGGNWVFSQGDEWKLVATDWDRALNELVEGGK